MQIGEKLYQLRKMAGITQEQLAIQLNVSRQTISKWEAGTSTPDIDSVVKISKLFQISLDELLLNESDENTEVAEQGKTATSASVLEKLVKINRRNRYITIGIIGVLIFLLGIILGSVFVTELRDTTSRMEYSFYRQMELGEHEGAIIETNAEKPAFLVADGTYEDHGKQVAMSCDVYYVVEDKVKKLGSVFSAGTAYPIAYDYTGIYTASGHSIQRYEIDAEAGVLVLAEAVLELYDEEGNVSYQKTTYDATEDSTEDEFMKLVQAYGRATVVSFE